MSLNQTHPIEDGYNSYKYRMKIKTHYRLFQKMEIENLQTLYNTFSMNKMVLWYA